MCAHNNVGVYIDGSADVCDCVLDHGASIYKSVSAVNCVLGEDAIIGDFSRTAGSTYGRGVRIQRNALIYDSVIGDYSFTGKNTTIWHATVGKYCSISWNVSIGGANHDYKRMTTHSFVYAPEFGFINGKAPAYERFNDDCSIGNDVWIGCHAIICRGVHVADGAVVAAGAVVTRDVSPYEIVAGVPARHLNCRFDQETIDVLLELKWWDLPVQTIKENVELFGSVVDQETLSRLLTIRNDHFDVPDCKPKTD